MLLTKDKYANYDKIFLKHNEYISDGFDFPVGFSDAKGYYNAQKFGKNNHLGEDWNGNGGGNTDMGDPVYAASNGYVSFSDDIGGGWGYVIRIIHHLKDTTKRKYVETLYAHLESPKPKEGDFVKRGQKIGEMGNINGLYYAHLHFELRSNVFMELGGGYGEDKRGFLDPTSFIKKNRPKN